MCDLGQNLLLSSLTDFYNKNAEYKITLKNIINGNHKLSLRIIEWLVTHYSKSNNIYYWIDENKNIYSDYPDDYCKVDSKEYKKSISKINLYQDYRAQLKSYRKCNFNSFIRHNRITFCINNELKDYNKKNEVTHNIYRWKVNNNIIT